MYGLVSKNRGNEGITVLRQMGIMELSIWVLGVSKDITNF
jgi:hypothetical protein